MVYWGGHGYCSKRTGSYYFHPGAELAVSGGVTDQLSGSKSRYRQKGPSPLFNLGSCWRAVLESGGAMAWGLALADQWQRTRPSGSHTSVFHIYVCLWGPNLESHGEENAEKTSSSYTESTKCQDTALRSTTELRKCVTTDSLVHTHNRTHSVKLSFVVALSSPSSVPMVSCLDSLPGLVFSLQFMPWGIMQSVPGFTAWQMSSS